MQLRWMTEDCFDGITDGMHKVRSLAARAAIGVLAGVMALLLAVPGAHAQGGAAPAVGDGSAGNPYQITQLSNLVWMATNGVAATTGKYYKLMNNIDATATAGWNAGAGFVPIWFRGFFNGNGCVIRNLTINRPNQDGVGLFGSVGDTNAPFDSAAVSNLGVVACSVRGSNFVGGVVGYNDKGGNVIRCFVRGGTVTGVYEVGGVVGANDDRSTLRECYSTCSVSGSDTVGGIAGFSGFQRGITDCYATGAVSGGTNVGGIVGHNDGPVTFCYAAGPVTGTARVGGLVGTNEFGHSTVPIDPPAPPVVTNCYWDTNTTGRATSPNGGKGKSTASMKQQATFAGWNFGGTWGIREGAAYPHLLWQPDDIAYVRSSSPLLTWYVDSTGDRTSDRTFQYAVSGDRPIVGDMDGNGDEDVAITRDFNGLLVWHVDTDGNGATDRIFAYGVSGDRAVSGDVDGDGRDDIVITRDWNGQLVWHCDLDGNGTTDQIFAYGVAGDHAALGDIDGDGTDDIAITRNFSTSLAWHVDLDRNGTTDTIFAYGANDDWGVIGNIDQARP